ncbi:chromate transporter [Peptoniphilus stercorisuis]|uniref:Chromate transporter n=1 Tax=Peptoniphilus stercorisuis TaxID=1436965 RepID=A0ABS4KAY0_9FIRM|nr:chromate transporter [Peptoniphilus stercorisuis]MBP2024495.1 chromate transporter [Peptoniphilus stercorisuis]
MISLMVQLYFTFLKIGALAFGGGYATIPLIERYVVNENGWLIMEEFIDLISISQMTPGPIAVNAATFVGQKVGGFVGAVIATLGVITPQFILMMILGYFLFSKGKKFKALDWILNGIKAGVVSLILITAIELFVTSLFPEGINAFKIVPAITFIVGFILYIKKIDMLKIIGISALCGIILNFVI